MGVGTYWRAWRSARAPLRSVRPQTPMRRLVSSSRSTTRSRKVSRPRRRPLGGGEGDGGNETVSPNGEAAAAEEWQICGAQPVISTPVASPHARTNGHAPSELALASQPAAPAPRERIVLLLKRGGLVIDCENAVVWTPGG